MNNLPTLAFKLSRLLGQPAVLQQMKANARRLGRPQAAFDIAARRWAIRRTEFIPFLYVERSSFRLSERTDATE